MWTDLEIIAFSRITRCPSHLPCMGFREIQTFLPVNWNVVKCDMYTDISQRHSPRTGNICTCWPLGIQPALIHKHLNKMLRNASYQSDATQTLVRNWSLADVDAQNHVITDNRRQKRYTRNRYMFKIPFYCTIASIILTFVAGSTKVLHQSRLNVHNSCCTERISCKTQEINWPATRFFFARIFVRRYGAILVIRELNIFPLDSYFTYACDNECNKLGNKTC